MESFEDENAKVFAQYVAKAYTTSEEHKLKFTIRGWQNEIFKKMLEEKLLIDKNGKKIENFGFYNNKMPIKLPKDKCIMAKIFASFEEVDGIVKYLSDFVRAPACTFLNPETMNEDRKKKQEQRSDKKSEYIQKKRQEKATDKKPVEKTEKKDAPKKDSTKQKAPFIKRNPKQEKTDIQIEVPKDKPVIKSFFISLDQFPEGAGVKIMEALKDKIKTARIF